jgi:hypothetical protein
MHANNRQPAQRQNAKALKKPYERKPAPANSFVTSKSPLSNTAHVKVMRFHDYHGTPTLFLVVDENGRELCHRFPYEPDALAHCEALELELPEPDTQDQVDEQ